MSKGKPAKQGRKVHIYLPQVFLDEMQAEGKRLGWALPEVVRRAWQIARPAILKLPTAPSLLLLLVLGGCPRAPHPPTPGERDAGHGVPSRIEQDRHPPGWERSGDEGRSPPEICGIANPLVLTREQAICLYRWVCDHEGLDRELRRKSCLNAAAMLAGKPRPYPDPEEDTRPQKPPPPPADKSPGKALPPWWERERPSEQQPVIGDAAEGGSDA